VNPIGVVLHGFVKATGSMPVPGPVSGTFGNGDGLFLWLPSRNFTPDILRNCFF
jgi:hypothetical protein